MLECVNVRKLALKYINFAQIDGKRELDLQTRDKVITHSESREIGIELCQIYPSPDLTSRGFFVYAAPPVRSKHCAGLMV